MQFLLPLTLLAIFVTVAQAASTKINPNDVETLLKEIRKKLKEKHDKFLAAEAEKNKTNVVEDKVEGSGSSNDIESSGEGSGDVDGSGSGDGSGASFSLDSDNAMLNAVDDEVLAKKADLETLTLNEMKAKAPEQLKEKFDINPVETTQILKGLDIHGPTGGYHRALSGGYLSPATYDPHNVNWSSYKDDSEQRKKEAIRAFRSAFLSPN